MNRCTSADACRAGACAGTAVTCTGGGGQCQDPAACDPADGVCKVPNKLPGTGCNDGNACTPTDSCGGGAQAGMCVGAGAVPCPETACQMAGSCDAATGMCTRTNKTNGTACNVDNNLCTTDSCQNGVCTVGPTRTCAAGMACQAASSCNPANGQCEGGSNLPNGTGCDDGNACTGPDTCTGGVCAGSVNVTCPGATMCRNAQTCDTNTGTCVGGGARTGEACNDGSMCTTGDACGSDGECQGTAVACHGETACLNAGVCDAGQRLRGADAEVGGHGVRRRQRLHHRRSLRRGGRVRGGDGADELPVEQRLPGGRGVRSVERDVWSGIAEQRRCLQRQQRLHRGDTCSGGSCQPGAPLTCPPPPVCFQGGCDPVMGLHEWRSRCPGNDVRRRRHVHDGRHLQRRGTCNPGAAVDCSDSDMCTDDSCAAATGACTPPDGLQRQQHVHGRQLRGGAGCVFTPITCNDNNMCTMDSCSAATGCMFTPVDLRRLERRDDGHVQSGHGCVRAHVTAPAIQHVPEQADSNRNFAGGRPRTSLPNQDGPPSSLPALPACSADLGWPPSRRRTPAHLRAAEGRHTPRARRTGRGSRPMSPCGQIRGCRRFVRNACSRPCAARSPPAAGRRFA